MYRHFLNIALEKTAELTIGFTTKSHTAVRAKLKEIHTL